MPINEDRDKRKDKVVRDQLGQARRLRESAVHTLNEANMLLESALSKYEAHFGTQERTD